MKRKCPLTDYFQATILESQKPMSWAYKGGLTVFVCTITSRWQHKPKGGRSETFTFAATTGMAARQHLLTKLCDLWKEENRGKELPKNTIDTFDKLWKELGEYYSWTVMELAVHTQEKNRYLSERELLEYYKRKLWPADDERRAQARAQALDHARTGAARISAAVLASDAPKMR